MDEDGSGSLDKDELLVGLNRIGNQEENHRHNNLLSCISRSSSAPLALLPFPCPPPLIRHLTRKDQRHLPHVRQTADAGPVWQHPDLKVLRQHRRLQLRYSTRTRGD
eukprot:223331-Hanusia_phi.AAC.3